MATAEPAAGQLPQTGASVSLSSQWRQLTRAATFVAFLTSPAAFFWLHDHLGWSVPRSVIVTAIAVLAFRGLVDIGFRRFIPWPSLFGTDDTRLKEEDIVNRRRAWFWTKRYRLAYNLVLLFVTVVTVIWFLKWVSGKDASWPGQLTTILHKLTNVHVFNASTLVLFFQFFIFFIFNFLIFMGPMMMMGISQIHGYEPGDADWGVKLDHVRGQAEAKEEVRRVVTLWQSGEAFEKAGGKRERGLLFLGAPGTGKTMLAKAIATGFNSPFVSIPGSGFAQTFIGIDALIVRFLARKAKKLAAKWGGQCIVFIDEIDAVGRRRSALDGSSGMSGASPESFHDHCFYGPNGALTPTGDLILESRAWRDRLFATRAQQTTSPYPGWYQRLSGIVNQGIGGGMFGGMGGQLALNQLLVTMDGIDNPPFFQRFWTNRINSILDASYIVPRRIGRVSLRLPRPHPANNQIYFIGATNVPMDALDPALTRPGRLGRHVWFRTPTKQDRLDIFDLYVSKVAHEPDLDEPKRRDELARITNGYSPAMIEQVCSMALTYAHHDFRERFGWNDLVEAMTTVESGTAVGGEYIKEETRAVAIHEAGHAAAAHVYMKGAESTRLSIRRRGASLGHHQALEKEERFSSWQHEEAARLVWTLGAMAAERVFYGENSTGVGGDVQSATARAAWMVGACAMAPEEVQLNGQFLTEEKREQAREDIMKRFEKIGSRIMNRTGGGDPFHHDPIAGVFSDPGKRAFAMQILGQAYVNAYLFVLHNKDGIEQIAGRLIEKRELYGDDLVRVLDDAKLEIPKVDLSDESIWPKV